MSIRGNRFVLALVLWCSFSVVGPSLSVADVGQLEVVCDWGKDIDVSPFVVAARFQSQLPKLEHHTLKKNSGGKSTPHQSENWLSPESVCDVPVDFLKECSAQLKVFQGDYYWKFDCGVRVSGELSFEQGSSGEGMINLSCKGEQVSDKKKQRVILGCQKVRS